MIPIGSDRPIQRFPIVTSLLMIFHLAVYALHHFVMSSPDAANRLFGVIPAALFNPSLPGIAPHAPVVLTYFTAIFLHTNIVHLLGNLMFLWVFGRNVEDEFGHIYFLLFYVLSGMISFFVYALAFPASTIPVVGASGAIAGVMGAYFLRFPLSQIRILVVFFFFIRVVPIPAFLLLGAWFVIQVGAVFMQMSGSSVSIALDSIAWVAHAAGFITGFIVMGYNAWKKAVSADYE